MRGALFEYLRLMWRHWWQLVIGVAAGIAGLLTDMEAIPEPLPSWVWWGLAVATFAIAQFMSFLTLHREVAKFRSKPKPDIYLHTIFDRLCESVPQVSILSDPIESAINSIVEKAASDDIQIYGAKRLPDDGGGPVVPIDATYWGDHSITPYGKKLYFGKSPYDRAIALRTCGENEDEVYYTLRTDSRQAELCWPRERRFKLQLPFRRETVDVSR